MLIAMVAVNNAVGTDQVVVGFADVIRVSVLIQTTMRNV